LKIYILKILFIFVSFLWCQMDTTINISGTSNIIIADTEKPSIEWILPNNGEEFNQGEIVNLTWQGIDESFNDSSISIYLSTYLGSNFESIFSGIANSENISYQLPNIDSPFARFKIYAIDSYGNSNIDYSDNYFIIGDPYIWNDNEFDEEEIYLNINGSSNYIVADTKKPEILWQYPNGNEEFEQGEMVNLSWYGFDDTFNNQSISIFFSEQIGSNFGVVQDNFDNSQTINFDLPFLDSPFSRFKITAIDSFGNQSTDFSDQYFTIGDPYFYNSNNNNIIELSISNASENIIADTDPPLLEWLYPQDGEQFDKNETISTLWNAEDDSFNDESISIYLSEQLGGFYDPVIENIANNLSYDVNLPFVDQAFARFKIKAIDSFGNQSEDYGNNYFIIGDPFGEYNVNPYEDLVILDWGWGDYHNILVTHDALSFMDDGDEVHIVDENGIISDQCITSDSNEIYFGALTENSIEILYNSLIEISGFQFDINGDVNIIRGEGGDAGSVGFTIVTNSSTVLGFSVDGATLPPGSGVLTILEVDYTTFEACLNDVIVSDANQEAVDFDTGNCYDENYTIPSLEIYGAVSVAKQTYFESDTNPLNLYCVEGYDYCDDTNSVYPGYVKGNPVSMLHYDVSQDTFYELNPQFSSWSGNFGDTPQDTLTFKYYSASENKTYTINETIPFTPSMIEGDAMFPVEYTFDENSFVEGEIECEFNPYDFEYWGAITSTVDNVEVGDQFATFVNGECRGLNSAIESPFETTIFLLDVYGNAALSVISSFNRSRSAITDIDYQVSSSTRQDYNFNIYRDDSILESDINEYYFIDESTEDGQSYCYTITLTDNQGNEALVSQNQCIDLGLDLGQLQGDINGDDILNILDIVSLVTLVLNGGNNPAADINEDGLINILDIVTLVTLVLNA